MIDVCERNIIMRKIVMTALAFVLVSGCAYTQHSFAGNPEHDKTHLQSEDVQNDDAYKLYNANTNSMVDIDKALARARVRGTKIIVVMGANWCHDSIGFAARMDKPEFKALIEQNYELVYVNAGTKPGQKDQNRAVSKRFGVKKIVGTPTIFIARPDGTVLNPDSAGYWRNAYSIPEDMSYAYLAYYADK
ncbi:MAG: hypothetical protein COA91_11055 [Robiginitomaculum sp.]|nr:MAG: hypothetical protein COA91_11055 [Robiginitomaculum sp.]